jgi:activator of Hsp90 ATPase-like protein
VYTWQWENAFEEMPETRVFVELRALGPATELLLTHEGLPEVPICLQHRSGWLAALDRIERIVADTQAD